MVTRSEDVKLKANFLSRITSSVAMANLLILKNSKKKKKNYKHIEGLALATTTT